MARVIINPMEPIDTEASTYVMQYPQKEHDISCGVGCYQGTPILFISDGADPYKNELLGSFRTLSLIEDGKRYGGAGQPEIAGAGSGFDLSFRHQADHLLSELDSMSGKLGSFAKEPGPLPWVNQPGRDDKKEEERDQDDELPSEHAAVLTMGSTLGTEENYDPEGPVAHAGRVAAFPQTVGLGRNDIYIRDKNLRSEHVTSRTTLIEGDYNSEVVVTHPGNPGASRPTLPGEPLVKQAGTGQGHISEVHTVKSQEKLPGGRAERPGTQGTRKRQPKEHDRKDDEDDEDDDNSGFLPESSGKKAKIENSRKLWACPFAKLDPLRYQECLHAKLVKFSYVKQHLNRSHAATYCPRCGQEFPDENSISDHLRADICEVRNFSLDGKMTRDTKNKVMDAKGRKLDDVERWYRMWATLFSDTKPPQSPYAESPAVEILNAFGASMRRDIGSRVLGEVRDQGLPLEDRIRLIEDTVSAFVRHLQENTPFPGSRDASPSITDRSTQKNTSIMDPQLTMRPQFNSSFSTSRSTLATNHCSSVVASTSELSLNSAPTSTTTGSSNSSRSWSCGEGPSSSASAKVKLSPANQDSLSQEIVLLGQVPSPHNEGHFEATDSRHCLELTSYSAPMTNILGGEMQYLSPAPSDSIRCPYPDAWEDPMMSFDSYDPSYDFSFDNLQPGIDLRFSGATEAPGMGSSPVFRFTSNYCGD